MTKSEFIRTVQVRVEHDLGLEIAKKDIESVVQSIFDVIGQEVADGSTQTIPEFGTFKPKHRKAKKGRNPQTGQPMQIPASTTVAFKPAPALKVLIG